MRLISSAVEICSNGASQLRHRTFLRHSHFADDLVQLAAECTQVHTESSPVVLVLFWNVLPRPPDALVQDRYETARCEMRVQLEHPADLFEVCLRHADG